MKGILNKIPKKIQPWIIMILHSLVIAAWALLMKWFLPYIKSECYDIDNIKYCITLTEQNFTMGNGADYD